MISSASLRNMQAENPLLKEPRVLKQLVKVHIKPTSTGYPRIMKSKVTNLIVMFEQENWGTVIVADDTYRQGLFNSNWAMSSFSPFHGRIILDVERT